MTAAEVYLLEPQVAANYRGMQTAAAALVSMPSAGSNRVDVTAARAGNAEHRGRACAGTSGDQQAGGVSSSRSPSAWSGIWRRP